MADSGNESKGGRGSCALFVVGAIVIVALIGSCSANSSNDSYRQTLNNGIQKYENNEPMTKEEHDAVKGFQDWKSNQGEHTYNEWENN